MPFITASFPWQPLDLVITFQEIILISPIELCTKWQQQVWHLIGHNFVHHINIRCSRNWHLIIIFTKLATSNFMEIIILLPSPSILIIIFAGPFQVFKFWWIDRSHPKYFNYKTHPVLSTSVTICTKLTHSLLSTLIIIYTKLIHSVLSTSIIIYNWIDTSCTEYFNNYFPVNWHPILST